MISKNTNNSFEFVGNTAEIYANNDSALITHSCDCTEEQCTWFNC